MATVFAREKLAGPGRQGSHRFGAGKLSRCLELGRGFAGVGVRTPGCPAPWILEKQATGESPGFFRFWCLGVWRWRCVEGFEELWRISSKRKLRARQKNAWRRTVLHDGVDCSLAPLRQPEVTAVLGNVEERPRTSSIMSGLHCSGRGKWHDFHKLRVGSRESGRSTQVLRSSLRTSGRRKMHSFLRTYCAGRPQ